MPENDDWMSRGLDAYHASGMAGHAPAPWLDDMNLPTHLAPDSMSPNAASNTGVGFGARAGNFLRGSYDHGFLGKMKDLNANVLNAGTVPGALAYGIGGYGLGYGGGKLAELLGAAPGTAGALGALLGLGGTALGGYSGYARTHKTASFSDDAILQALSRDASLSSSQIAALAARARNLDEATKQQVLDMIRRLGFAAAAAVVTRFLGGGTGMQIGAGLAGGWLGGNAVDQVQEWNPLGNGRMFQHTDNMGHPYFL